MLHIFNNLIILIPLDFTRKKTTKNVVREYAKNKLLKDSDIWSLRLILEMGQTNNF